MCPPTTSEPFKLAPWNRSKKSPIWSIKEAIVVHQKQKTMLFSTTLLASVSLAQPAAPTQNLPKCRSFVVNDDWVWGCPDGKQKDAGLCYNPCPEGFKGVGPVCWKGAKSHPRGVGSPLVGRCPRGDRSIEGFCYKECPPHHIEDVLDNGKRATCTENPDFFHCEL